MLIGVWVPVQRHAMFTWEGYQGIFMNCFFCLGNSRGPQSQKLPHIEAFFKFFQFFTPEQGQKFYFNNQTSQYDLDISKSISLKSSSNIEASKF